MLLLLGMLPLSAARAQTLADRCRQAAAIVARGYTPANDRWAALFIANCTAEAGPAIAAGVRALRSSSDTAQLEVTTTPSWGLRDAEIFTAAKEVAADPSATEEARLYSLRTLWWYMQRQPANLSYDRMHVTAPLGAIGTCPIPIGPPGADPRNGTRLPSNSDAQSRALGAQIAADAGAPNSVRNFGWCIAHMP